MSDNWVVQMLTNILNTWNSKLAEIWTLVTMSPQEFKGGAVWGVIVNIHNALMAIGIALLVLFFVVGVMKTCGNFAEVKRPEVAVKLFIRFILAKAVVTYGMELMLSLLSIIQGIISTILRSAGMGEAGTVTLPEELIKTIEKCGFFESIPLWIVFLIGCLFVWILSMVLILSVYGVPFADAACRIGKSNNVILCGHHMTSETMFHEIVYYEDPDFFKDHRRIIFDTLESEGEYEVIAVFRFDTDHESFRFNRYIDMDMNEFAEFMKCVHERELYSTGLDAVYGNQLLTLSTCDYFYNNGRFVVVAKEVS